jgi:hypothetical protein
MQALLLDFSIQSASVACIGVLSCSRCCRAFATTEEGMRYCEGQFLEVAQRHGLCRPSSSVLSLKDILELNASVVRFCMILT